MEYNLVITWIESQNLQKYPSNIIPNPFEMMWSMGLEKKNHNTNTLKIMAGIIGCTQSKDNYKYYMDYSDIYGKIIYAIPDTQTDKVIFNIQYIDENKN